MNKIIGIIILVVSLLMTNIGVAIYVNSETQRSNEFYKKFIEVSKGLDFQNSFVRDYEKDVQYSVILIIIGIIIFVLGIYVTASKTKKQKEIEFELNFLKSQKQ